VAPECFSLLKSRHIQCCVDVGFLGLCFSIPKIVHKSGTKQALDQWVCKDKQSFGVEICSSRGIVLPSVLIRLGLGKCSHSATLRLRPNWWVTGG